MGSTKMEQAVCDFLKKYLTTSRWLDDIIDVLIQVGGRAHVHKIAGELSKSYSRDIDFVEETVTRRINDFCSDAKDFKKGHRHDLFARVEPATYQLRSYPERPDIIELIRIEFDDIELQGMYKEFSMKVKKQNPLAWKRASNEKKLSGFVKWMSNAARLRELERRKAANSLCVFDLSDLGK